MKFHKCTVDGIRNGFGGEQMLEFRDSFIMGRVAQTGYLMDRRFDLQWNLKRKIQWAWKQRYKGYYFLWLGDE